MGSVVCPPTYEEARHEIEINEARILELEGALREAGEWFRANYPSVTGGMDNHIAVKIREVLATPAGLLGGAKS